MEFTVIHLKLIMFLGYVVLQLFLFTICASCNVISHVRYVLYIYISTLRSLCTVPNMAVFFLVVPRFRSPPIYYYYYYYYYYSQFCYNVMGAFL